MTNSANGKLSDPFSVLMVEDSPPQALKMKMALENGGCRVYWSETGFGGLGMAQERKFDLIILDVELPDINGFDICRKLKADDELKDIPVVMLTTLDSASDVFRTNGGSREKEFEREREMLLKERGQVQIEKAWLKKKLKQLGIPE